MSKTLYLECCSGISGDMTVAALLDLGADQKVLKETLDSLPVQGFEIAISRVKKSGIDACDFDVILEQDNHDHDMAYLHGHHGRHSHEEKHEHHQNEHSYDENHEHHHGEDNQKEIHAHHHHGEHSHEEIHAHHHHGEHSHEEPHDHHHHEEHHHKHAHRGMNEIREIVQQAQMTDGARQLTMKIFGILAEAEAKAHNLSVDQVHFHEVGAVDSIVDIISAAVCLDNLGITEVIVTELYEGQGSIRCQHGILPVPVPAVANIVQAHSLPIHLTNVQGELVTPTGAAIAAAIRTSAALPETFCIDKIGIGAGKREYGLSGILRAMLIHASDSLV